MRGRDANGDTPLSLAVQRGHPAIVHDALYTLACNELERSPLSTAAQSKSADAGLTTVRDYLEARNANDATCIDIARQLGTVPKNQPASPYPRAAYVSHAAAAKFAELYTFLERGARERNPAHYFASRTRFARGESASRRLLRSWRMSHVDHALFLAYAIHA
jgi:ankyrin repeat protein